MDRAEQEDVDRAHDAVYHDPEEFGRRIRAARAHADLNRKALASKLGVSESDVRRWEEADETKRRVSAQIRKGFLQSVAEATGIPRGWLERPFDAFRELTPEEREEQERKLDEFRREYGAAHKAMQEVTRRIAELEETSSKQRQEMSEKLAALTQEAADKVIVPGEPAEGAELSEAEVAPELPASDEQAEEGRRVGDA